MCDVYCCTPATPTTQACCTKVRTKATCSCNDGCHAMGAPNGVTSFVCSGKTDTFKVDAYVLLSSVENRRLMNTDTSGCKDNYMQRAASTYCTDYSMSDGCSILSAAPSLTINPFLVLVSFIVMIMLKPRWNSEAQHFPIANLQTEQRRTNRYRHHSRAPRVKFIGGGTSSVDP